MKLPKKPFSSAVSLLVRCLVRPLVFWCDVWLDENLFAINELSIFEVITANY